LGKFVIDTIGFSLLPGGGGLGGGGLGGGGLGLGGGGLGGGGLGGGGILLRYILTYESPQDES
tara:strand:- start:415 stop:603 length:189 start_codon:yes stop_codon:yes gene_type:complete